MRKPGLSGSGLASHVISDHCPRNSFVPLPHGAQAILYSVPLVIIDHMIRAILLATATVTTLK